MFNFRTLNRVFIISLILLFSFMNLRGWQPDTETRFEFHHPGMGSVFRIICYGNDQHHAEKIAQSAFAKLDSLNLIMSDYLPHSELMQLCKESGCGRYRKVSDELFNVLGISQEWSKKSNGDFDITIGALTKLWRRAGRKERVPEADQLKRSRELVDYQFVKLDSAEQKVLLEKEGMLLDLGGIAKGYAVDQLFMIMSQSGYDRCLVDGGGDIRVGDAPRFKKGWEIKLPGEVEDSIILMVNQSVATSGDLYRFVELNGIRYSHIIDPSTGYGVTIPRTVTVFAEDCTTADVTASILSVKGFSSGFEFLEKAPVEAAIIRENVNGKIRKYSYKRLAEEFEEK